MIEKIIIDKDTRIIPKRDWDLVIYCISFILIGGVLMFSIISINKVMEIRLITQGLTPECIESAYCSDLMIDTMENMRFDKRHDERKDIYDLFIKYQDLGVEVLE